MVMSGYLMVIGDATLGQGIEAVSVALGVFQATGVARLAPLNQCS